MNEDRISREIQELLKTVGFAIWSTEQGYRKDRGGTRQTPGMADLYVLGHGRALWVEVKTPKGKIRNSQKMFGTECERNGVDWFVWRDATDAWDWLVSEGFIEEA